MWSVFCSRNVHGALLTIAVQSLIIAGWVTMSRPLEIYLYEWWPLRRRGQIFEKLSRMHVEVRKRCDAEWFPRSVSFFTSIPLHLQKMESPSQFPVSAFPLTGACSS